MSAEPPSAGDRPEPPRATAVAPAGKPAAATPQSPVARFFAYRRFWLMAGALFTFDQLTKYWINARMPLGSYGSGGRTVIPGFFNLVHVGNTGAAWSMFSGKSTGLALLASGTLVAMYLFRRQLGLQQPSAQPAFGLLCGGVVGNLVDRLTHGHVIDFIDLHFGAYIYPTFNVADSGIFVGVFWYILWSLKQPTDGGNPKSPLAKSK